MAILSRIKASQTKFSGAGVFGATAAGAGEELAIDTDIAGGVSANHDTLASAKAIKAYVDGQDHAENIVYRVDGGADITLNLETKKFDYVTGEGLDLVKSVSGDYDVLTFSAEEATSANKGVASFSDDNFSVTSGAVTIKNAGVANAELVNSVITIGASDTALGGTVTGVQVVATLNSDLGADFVIGTTTDDEMQLTGDLKIGHGELQFGSGQDADIYVQSTAQGVVGKNMEISSGSPLTGGADDIAGGHLDFKGGQGKGSAAGGNIRFYVSDGASSGNSLNNHALAMTIGDDKTVTLAGNLVVSGTTTTISSTQLTVADDLITVSKGNDTLTNANGSGMEIDVTNGTNIAWLYSHAQTAWESNVDVNLASATESYKINDVEVLSSTGLGAGVVGSSLTSVGIITSGTWTGGAVADAYVANDLTISGGTVNNSIIGGSTAAAGTFTSLVLDGANDQALDLTAQDSLILMKDNAATALRFGTAENAPFMTFDSTDNQESVTVNQGFSAAGGLISLSLNERFWGRYTVAASPVQQNVAAEAAAGDYDHAVKKATITPDGGSAMDFMMFATGRRNTSAGAIDDYRLNGVSLIVESLAANVVFAAPTHATVLGAAALPAGADTHRGNMVATGACEADALLIRDNENSSTVYLAIPLANLATGDLVYSRCA